MNPLLLLPLALLPSPQEPQDSQEPELVRIPSLEFVGRYESGRDAGTEIVSVQARTARAVLSNSETGRVDLLDLVEPQAPRRLATFDLLASHKEELTSVAFHPTEDYFLAVLEAPGTWERGRLLLVDATTGALWAELATGIGPDCVMIDPTGSYALVANEAEEFSGPLEDPVSPTGSLTFIDLRGGRRGLHAVQLPLPDATGVPGTSKPSDMRFLERNVGKQEDCLVPLGDLTPDRLEPEYIAWSPDGSRAWVVLQEANALALFVSDPPQVKAIVGCGTTRHAADLTHDDEVRFDTMLFALREPDGLTITMDGRYIVTADEGDTEPGPGVEGPGVPASGGRTVSVFDGATGALLGDTGNQLEEALHAAGLYRDKWSPKGGCQPENVVAFNSDGTNWVVAGLEKANALALISLADPSAPHVVSVAPLPAGSEAPEGLALFQRGTRILVLTANEDSGDLTLFRFVP